MSQIDESQLLFGVLGLQALAGPHRADLGSNVGLSHQALGDQVTGRLDALLAIGQQGQLGIEILQKMLSVLVAVN